MTPRPASELPRILRRQHRAHVGALAAHAALRIGAYVVATLAAAVLLGAAFAGGAGAAWARLGLVLTAVAGILALAARRFARDRPGFDTYLESVERRFPEIRSWLRNGLEFSDRSPANGSSDLANAVAQETARRVDGLPLEAMRPRLDPRRPLLIAGAAIALVVVAALVAPSRTGRSWATLVRPALAAPPIRLVVEPGSVTVTPGAALSVRARVWGSTRRPDLQRDGEPAPEAVREGVLADGSSAWRFDLSQLTREQGYRVRVAHVTSPRYRIALSGEPMPVSFDIEYQAPGYARIPVRRGAATRGDLEGLRGTRARIEVTFDRDLESLAATLPGGGTGAWKKLTARRWQGEVPIDRPGDYALRAEAASGSGNYRYRVQPLDDAPPLLTVQVPTGDLDLPAGQQIPVDVICQDDLGLAELRLQYRKDPSAPWSQLPLARFSGQPREAGVRSRWDASGLALMPGETATFRFELLDGNAVSGPGRTVSPTFELRFPSLADLYESIDRTQGGAQRTLERVAEEARELQKSLDKLGRQLPQQRSQESQPAFERSEELKQNLARQQELAKQIDTAAQQLRQSVEQSSEREAFSEELSRRLEEMHRLMEQIQSPEFKDAMKKMQEALEQLDRRALEEQLPTWRQENREMLEQLERTIELLKRMREEERLEALARRADELKQQQDALNREHQAREEGQQQSGQESSKGLEEQQRRAAEQSEQLSKDTREMAKSLESQDQKQAETTADQLDQQAATPQREASESTSRGQSSRARQKGQQASETLEQAARSLEQLAQERQNEQDGADLAMLRRSAQDLVSLQRESEANLRSSASMEERANRQTDLSEGAARVADSLYALGQRTPFLTPKLGEALGRAVKQLSESGRDLGNGNRARGEQSGKDGGAALNEAVLQLRQSEASMCEQPGPGQGNPQKSMGQRLGEVGQRQSQLNQRSRSLAKQLSQQMRLSAGNRDELQRMADEQARLRREVEQIEREDQVRRELLGRLEGARRDMQEVEEALKSGATSGDLEPMQQRILSRLLDAQRSVNRRDFDPERESRPGEEIVTRSAPELPADLMRENDRLRHDLLKSEADRYPARYRAFVETYLRSLNGSRR